MTILAQKFFINGKHVGNVIPSQNPRDADEAWYYATRMGRGLYWGPTAADCRAWAERNIDEHGTMPE